MPSNKIKVSDFVKASRTYAESVVKRANADGNQYLTKTEAKRLTKDLQDNYKNLGTDRVKAKDFVNTFVKYVATNAKKADLNGDGYLTLTDGRKLPQDLRDNFKNYVAATRPVFDTGEATVKDKTSASRVAAHIAEYGQPRVGYADAFQKAIKAVMKDREYGPGSVLKEVGDGNGNELTDRQIEAELKKAFKSMTLLPPGESEESYFEPDKQWIFRVDCDVGSDHGFWVGVDRTTGQADVTNFN